MDDPLSEVKKDVHYICPGECNGVSDKPGFCQAENLCSGFNQPLVQCDCEDQNHLSKLPN